MILAILDPGDGAAVRAYEQAFHAAYLRMAGNRLVRTLWEWDDGAGRVRTRIPYGDQLVFTVRDGDGTIVLGGGVNTAMRELQSAAFGFAVPAGEPAPCELLTLFSAGDRRHLPHLRPMWDRTFAILAARGFRSAWATSAPPILPLHRRLGAVEVERRAIGDTWRHWLRYAVAPGAVAAAP